MSKTLLKRPHSLVVVISFEFHQIGLEEKVIFKIFKKFMG